MTSPSTVAALSQLSMPSRSGQTVKAKESSTQKIPLHFKGDLYPSAHGRLVRSVCFAWLLGSRAPSTHILLSRCHYRFDVECDIPWAPDIEVHLPVQIAAQPPTVWGVAPQW